MRTKNAKAITAAESAHIALVKALPCGVCSEPPPTQAHHVEQGQHFTVLPLCVSCHTDGFNGIHGQARIWKVRKLDELAVLNNTIRALYA